MIGPIINSAAIVVGSAAGALVGPKLSKTIKMNMPVVFGYSSMALGAAMIAKVSALAPVILAVVIGSLIGELVNLELLIQKLAAKTRSLVGKLAPSNGEISNEEFMDRFVALLVLFSVSGTGIYGSMNEGMTGDATLLIVKAILDLFTAMIFASSLGLVIGVLVIPQFLVQAILYLASSQIIPLTTPAMLADFSACGGILMLAVGMRLSGIKQYPVANMISALLLIMPLSGLWSVVFG